MFKMRPHRDPKIWGHELWLVSAYKGKSSTTNDGKTLLEIYNEHPEKFGYKDSNTEFPILVKVIDAKDHLSVQVHPDDKDAKRLDNYPYGKNECWYVLKGKDIVMGINPKDEKELRSEIDKGNWDNLLQLRDTKAGEFFNIPAGTVHAIRGGSKIFELQQSCDITYRFYDYGRLQDGKPRELHLEKAIQVTDYKPNTDIKHVLKKYDAFEAKRLIDNKFFAQTLITLHGQEVDIQKELRTNKFAYVSNIGNNIALVNGIELKQYDTAIIEHSELNIPVEATGSTQLMVGWPK